VWLWPVWALLFVHFSVCGCCFSLFEACLCAWMTGSASAVLVLCVLFTCVDGSTLFPVHVSCFLFISLASFLLFWRLLCLLLPSTSLLDITHSVDTWSSATFSYHENAAVGMCDHHCLKCCCSGVISFGFWLNALANPAYSRRHGSFCPPHLSRDSL
jgi:hypothetical protein